MKKIIIFVLLALQVKAGWPEVAGLDEKPNLPWALAETEGSPFLEGDFTSEEFKKPDVLWAMDDREELAEDDDDSDSLGCNSQNQENHGPVHRHAAGVIPENFSSPIAAMKAGYPLSSAAEKIKASPLQPQDDQPRMSPVKATSANVQSSSIERPRSQKARARRSNIKSLTWEIRNRRNFTSELHKNLKRANEEANVNNIEKIKREIAENEDCAKRCQLKLDELRASTLSDGRRTRAASDDKHRQHSIRPSSNPNRPQSAPPLYSTGGCFAASGSYYSRRVPLLNTPAPVAASVVLNPAAYGGYSPAGGMPYPHHPQARYYGAMSPPVMVSTPVMAAQRGAFPGYPAAAVPVIRTHSYVVVPHNRGPVVPARMYYYA